MAALRPMLHPILIVTVGFLGDLGGSAIDNCRMSS